MNETKKYTVIPVIYGKEVEVELPADMRDPTLRCELLNGFEKEYQPIQIEDMEIFELEQDGNDFQ